MADPLRLRYCTYEFKVCDIHLCSLRDTQQFSDPLGRAAALGICSASWSLFGIVWPSALVLGHYMDSYPFAGKRILEMGCGMGLSSLLLHKQGADITATDYHPEAESFLGRNTRLNECGALAYKQVDWAAQEDGLGLFDVIIGSDLLYEDQHVKLVADFIAAHASPCCEVVFVDPGRGRKNKLSHLLTDIGFEVTHFKPGSEGCLVPIESVPDGFKGYILKFSRAS